MAKIQVRRDTAINWESDPTLASGEFGLDTTNNILKIGDGDSAWSALSAIGSAGTSKNVYETILTYPDDELTWKEIGISIPQKSGASDYPGVVRLTIGQIEDDGSEYYWEGLLASGTNFGLQTVLSLMQVGRGQGSENLALISGKFQASLTAQGSMSSPYNKFSIRLEAYDPLSVFDMAGTTVSIVASYNSPTPSPMFT